MNVIFRSVRPLCSKLKFKKVLNTRSLCQSKNDEKISGTNLEEKSQSKLVTKLLDEAASFEECNPPEDQWTSSVYPKMTRRSQAQHSVRPSRDPKTTSILLFPGQGVQHVGMAKSLLEYDNVSQMFECASEILRYDLLDLCLNGPQEMLDETVHCQTAVMVSSLAAVEKLKAKSPEAIENCIAAAGFSVGEYAALVFAGALTFEDGVRLLKIRSEAMQASSELCDSGMMTVMLHPNAKINYACSAAKEWCIRKGIEDPECDVAIYLFPQCRVIGGHQEALKFLELNAEDLGIKKIKYLPVSGAFHTKLMKPAQNVLKKALEVIPLEMPLIPVHSNFDGKPYLTVKHVREKLCQQMCNPVKWEQVMHIIYERPVNTDFPHTYECGPGKSLRLVLKSNNLKAFQSSTAIMA